jgi:flagellar motor switch protein FliG
METMSDISLNQAAVDLHIEDLEKAAILMLSMGEEAAAKIFKRLNREEVRKLSGAIAKLKNVSTAEAKWILQQFFARYKQQSGISGTSRNYLQRTLDLALGPRFARGMLDGLYGDEVSHEVQLLQWVPPEVIGRFFVKEHPQLQAVLLAFLPAETSSAVLDVFPADQHDDLLLRVANLKEISEVVLQELRHTINLCLDYVAEQAGTQVDGVRQVADILNRYRGDRVRMLEMLRQYDSAVAIEVEKNMFDFNTLKRQTPEVLQTLLQEIPSEQLAVALKGTDAGFRKVVLGAMPKRMAQALETQIQGQGSVSISKVEQARSEIMQLVRSLVEQGEIEYQLFEEAVVS